MCVLMLRWEFPSFGQILHFHLMSPRMKTSFGVLPRDCRMIVVWEPRGRPPDVSRRPNQTTPEAVRDNQPSNNLSPSGTVRLLGWSWAKTHTYTQPFASSAFSRSACKWAYVFTAVLIILCVMMRAVKRGGSSLCVSYHTSHALRHIISHNICCRENRICN